MNSGPPPRPRSARAARSRLTLWLSAILPACGYTFPSAQKRSVPGGSGERAPFVPRELIAGRALLVFWPLVPWKGVLRLKWVD